jgi:hypothetical protein
MEVVAELRAAGATWETAALKVQRRAGLLRRWTKVYPEEWERLFREAEERQGREANNESRTVLREMLRSKEARARLAAAERLARLRLQEMAKQRPPDPHGDLAAFLAAAQEMSDAELDEYMAEFFAEIKAAGKPQAV